MWVKSCKQEPNLPPWASPLKAIIFIFSCQHGTMKLVLGNGWRLVNFETLDVKCFWNIPILCAHFLGQLHLACLLVHKHEASSSTLVNYFFFHLSTSSIESLAFSSPTWILDLCKSFFNIIDLNKLRTFEFRFYILCSFFWKLQWWWWRNWRG